MKWLKKFWKKNPWNYDSDNLRGCRTHSKTSLIKTKFIPKQFVTELKPSYSYTSQWHHYIHVHYTSSKNLEKVKKSLNDRAAYSWGVFFSWSNKAMSVWHSFTGKFPYVPKSQIFYTQTGYSSLALQTEQNVP